MVEELLRLEETVAEGMRISGLKKIPEINPDDPLAMVEHHARVYRVLATMFKEITDLEGKLFTFSFRKKDDLFVFTVLKEAAKELGLPQHSYEGSTPWQIFTAVQKDISPYWERIHNKPS